MTWVDRVTLTLAPRWTMRRMRARAAVDLFTRNYEGASAGRRTAGWRRSIGDANAPLYGNLARLREHARDLVRNNPYAESAVATVADHTVGWGIVAKPAKTAPRDQAQRFMKGWRAWAETPACDAEGRLDFAGLEKLAMRTVATDGEVLVRRRWRRLEDGLPLPLQLQVMEADYLDTLKDGIATASGGVIVQGVEYDVLGRRAAYWLYREHPGSSLAGIRTGITQSTRVPASEILHIFKAGRPGQTRAASWFAPIMLRLKDFDEYEDAALVKQKVAACLSVLTTDVDGTTPPLGESPADQPKWDMLEPGMITNVAPGRAITVVDPPSVSEHGPYAQTVLRAIAAGFGITYEDLCGDYAQMPFSAARMSRLRHWARVEDWRWRMLIPQFCDPVWLWALDAARVGGIIPARTLTGSVELLTAEWTAPPLPMLEPDKEGLAYARNIRAGIQTLPDAIRERGYDPTDFLAEYAESNKVLDKLGIVLDSDARMTTQQGGPRTTATPDTPPTPDKPEPVPASSNGNNGASRNGHEDPVERAFTILEKAFAQKYAQPIHVTGGPTTLNVEEGAIQTHVAPPALTVDAPTLFSEGSIRVNVDAPPPAAVTVTSPEVTIERGAVQVDVSAPTTIEPGAMTIAPGAITLTPPPEPKVTVVRSQRRRRRPPPPAASPESA